jgi:hypothetical protein
MDHLCSLAADLPDGIFEHPAYYPEAMDLRIITILVAQKLSCSAHCERRNTSTVKLLYQTSYRRAFFKKNSPEGPVES